MRRGAANILCCSCRQSMFDNSFPPSAAVTAAPHLRYLWVKFRLHSPLCALFKVTFPSRFQSHFPKSISKSLSQAVFIVIPKKFSKNFLSYFQKIPLALQCPDKAFLLYGTLPKSKLCSLFIPARVKNQSAASLTPRCLQRGI